jgi:V8-like Glu-specific endopeptidase
MLSSSIVDPLATPVSSYNRFPAAAFGKIFFYNTVKQRDESCSGTSLTQEHGGNGSVVDTAGHCVYDDGAWHTFWEFCPRYHNGNSPYGCWSANQLFATPGWANNEQPTSEFGMAVLQPLNGETIHYAVGGVDWQANFPQSILAGLSVTSYGYPTTPPYGDRGEQMYFIVRPLTFYTNVYGTFLKLDNDDMQEGTSGGPWLITYQGNQFLIGHSSFHLEGELANLSPYLNDDWLALLNIAKNAPNTGGDT